MTQASLLERIEAIEFSDEAAVQYQDLIATPPSDEEEAVIITAAAVLLARGRPGMTWDDDVALVRLGSEFIELMFAVRNLRRASTGRRGLRIVGGTDA
ncbi:hypothetical protein [Chachezhania antarctica]|uniref:hypothetical protein n=1 Tax=Chachezhania antarctica TaxID=2340860 RepID=UPI000EACD371|nr:hypothetical protein [Chachezhania antarctica]|tara:strand:- start:10717 stop:11010 length:294 start_codon:yes stop_codon:yes gene_type:complete